MKIWISKYALSAGITEHECPEPDEGSNRVYPGAPFMSFYGFDLGKDAHTTKTEAIAKAEKARIKKICALQSQITKLTKMEF